MFCPKCKCEYIDGIFTCSDCKVDLVHQLIAASDVDKKLQAVIPVKIKSVANEIEADLIMNLLKNNNIHCFRKSKEAGEYMRITTGFSVYGEDVYVDKSDYLTAIQLLDDVAQCKELIDEEDCDSDYHIPFYKKPQVIARITVIVAALALILSYILGKVNQH